MTPPITLYFAPYTRALRPRWLLEELAVPYAIQEVDLKAGAHRTDAYRRDVHPHGRVPALSIDGRVVIESAAIVAALADRFPDKHLAPPLGTTERTTYLEWLFYAQVTLESAVADVMATLGDGAGVSLEQAEKRRAFLAESLGHVERRLGAGPFALGDTFSAADCVLGAILFWAQVKKLVDGHPALLAYMERLKARPAYQRARKA